MKWIFAALLISLSTAAMAESKTKAGKNIIYYSDGSSDTVYSTGENKPNLPTENTNPRSPNVDIFMDDRKHRRR